MPDPFSSELPRFKNLYWRGFRGQKARHRRFELAGPLAGQFRMNRRENFAPMRTAVFPTVSDNPYRSRDFLQCRVYFSTPNLCTVWEMYVSPGRSTVLGKLGWFGESG